jgi:D-tyrosyl-tRNA(Tyr) deacylase
MRAVLQRVSRAKVTVDNRVVGEIGRGILLLAGMDSGDNASDYKYILDKSVNLRIFEDEKDKMNLSATDLGLGLLIIPNFTVYADARHGRRPSFAMGAKPEEAKVTFGEFVSYAKANFPVVESGIFQADMKVELVNDGPVTILLDSDKMF